MGRDENNDIGWISVYTRKFRIRNKSAASHRQTDGNFCDGLPCEMGPLIGQ